MISFNAYNRIYTKGKKGQGFVLPLLVCLCFIVNSSSVGAACTERVKPVSINEKLSTSNHIATAIPHPDSLITGFKAMGSGKGSLLTWAAVQTDVRGYYIEKSMDGALFTVIGYVSKGATADKSVSYQFKDAAAPEVVCYYRLGVVGADAAKRYSAAVKVQPQKEGKILHLYPTITTGTVTLQVDGTSEDEISLELYTNSGTPVWRKKTKLQPQSFNFSAVARGAYKLVINDAKGAPLHSTTIIKQ